MNPATSPLDLTERLATEQRARQNRLAALWQMTIAERVAAMRRGELTYEQLAAWTARHRSKSPPSMASSNGSPPRPRRPANDTADGQPHAQLVGRRRERWRADKGAHLPGGDVRRARASAGRT